MFWPLFEDINKNIIATVIKTVWSFWQTNISDRGRRKKNIENDISEEWMNKSIYSRPLTNFLSSLPLQLLLTLNGLTNLTT